MVAIQPIGGLASRMKCIASFAVIAHYFSVPLHVYWTGSAGFEEIGFEHLFDTNALSDSIQFIEKATWSHLLTERHVVRLDTAIPYLSQNEQKSENETSKDDKKTKFVKFGTLDFQNL